MFMLRNESCSIAPSRNPSTGHAESLTAVKHQHHVSIIAYKGCRFAMDILEGLAALNHQGQWRIDSELILVPGHAQAMEKGLFGSPTVLVDGWEYQAWRHGPAGLYCRAYLTLRGFVPCPDIHDMLTNRDVDNLLPLSARSPNDPVYPTLFSSDWCPQAQAARSFWMEAAGMAGCRLRLLDADSSEGRRQMLGSDIAGVPCLLAGPTRRIYGTPLSLTRAADFLQDQYVHNRH